MAWAIVRDEEAVLEDIESLSIKEAKKAEMADKKLAVILEQARHISLN